LVEHLGRPWILFHAAVFKGIQGQVRLRIGIGATPLKTEAMFFPPPRRSYSEADTSRLDVLDGTGNAIGFIDFATEFKYLGSIVQIL
jgi:hypothetical protein